MTQAINDTAADLGPRGLVIYGRHGKDSGRFDYVNEATWRDGPSYPLHAQNGPLASLSTLQVALARLNQSVFVDLDQLSQLGLSDGAIAVQNAAATNNAAVPLPIGPAIILKEFGKLYVVPADKWSTADIAISGDAAVLINRDAVLAPIPSNPIAEGTFCVLINLAALA